MIHDGTAVQEIDPRIGSGNYLDEQALAAYNHVVDKWVAAAEQRHAQPSQQPEVLADGLLLHYDEVSLYHGSFVEDLDHLEENHDNSLSHNTIGHGVYFTSNPDKAFGYARIRAHAHGEAPSATVYEATLHDITLVDLRTTDNIQRFMLGFTDYLVADIAHTDSLPIEEQGRYWWSARENYLRAVEVLKSETLRPGQLKNALHYTGGIFKKYVRSLGFDGVIAEEGGEPGEHGDLGDGHNGDHETWVVMNPEKATVTNVANFELFIKPDLAARAVAQALRNKRRELGLEWWEKLPEEQQATNSPKISAEQ